MKKVRLYQCYLFLFLSITAQAQIILSSACIGFRASDLLSKVDILWTEQDRCGKDLVWDLRESSVLSYRPLLFYDTPDEASGVIISSEQFANSLYSVRSNGIYRIGFTTPTLRMSYEQPECMLPFPLQYGDSTSTFFSGSGTYSDKFFVREYGSSTLSADAYGTMLLPEGDTLRHVLQVTTVRNVHIEMSPSDSISLHSPSQETPGHRTVIHRWYAAGYRYPVLEQVEGTAEAIFYPPGLQEEQLTDDDENIHVRQLIASGLYIEDGQRDNGQPPVIRYTMDQSSGRSTAGIDFDLDAPATVRLLLSDVMGVVCRQSAQDFPAGTGFHMELSLAGLPHRQYVLHISAGSDTFAEKVNHR